MKGGGRGGGRVNTGSRDEDDQWYGENEISIWLRVRDSVLMTMNSKSIGT